MSPVERSSGGAAAASNLLFSSILGADTALIDTGANGIAGGFNILEVYVMGRTDEAAILSSVSMTFNNDTGANYDFVWTGTSNTTNIAGNNLAQTAWNAQILGANAGATFSASLYIQVPAYTLTTFFKSANLLTARADGSAAANMSMLNFAGTYRSTAAITRFAVTPFTGGRKLKAGTAVYIYGK